MHVSQEITGTELSYRYRLALSRGQPASVFLSFMPAVATHIEIVRE